MIGDTWGHTGNYLQRGIAHGIVRGILARVQGGNFSRGFMSAFASVQFGRFSQALRDTGNAVKAAFHALVGGTVSLISGGKFGNGAVSAAVVYLFNDMGKVAIKKLTSVSIDENIKKIRWLMKHGFPGAAKYYFYMKVRPHGDWDYKLIYGKKLAEDLGNFNYGATGRAAGFKLNVLLKAAGLVQEYYGSYSHDFGHFYGYFPYGDDPDDQYMIMQGYYYYKRNYK